MRDGDKTYRNKVAYQITTKIVRIPLDRRWISRGRKRRPVHVPARHADCRLATADILDAAGNFEGLLVRSARQQGVND